MPSIEALNRMTQSIAGCDWDALKYPEHRIQVMTLAIAHEGNEIQDAIEGHMSELLKEAVKLNEQMDTLTDQMYHVSIWFEKSRLWEGL